MRILYIHSFSLSNSLSGHYVKNLASAVAAMNHEVGILAPGQLESLAGCQSFELRLPTVPSFDLIQSDQATSYFSMTRKMVLPRAVR